MTKGDDTLIFAYDAAGPMSVTWNGTTYYYVTNIQGDVVAILDANGNAMVRYTYDAWGNILSTTGDMAGTLGALNPLRYRGYVYDAETGLYYLQSRYYDAEIGRFICADDVKLLGANGNHVSLNIFAYCGNNPVARQDLSGEIWSLAINAVLGAATNVVTTYVAAKVTGQEYTLMDLTINAIAGATGALPFVGQIIGAAIAGAYTGYVSYTNGVSLGMSILNGTVTGACTLVSISNIAGWAYGEALDYGTATVSNVVFGMGGNTMSAATSRAIIDNTPSQTQTVAGPVGVSPSEEFSNFTLYFEGPIWRF